MNLARSGLNLVILGFFLSGCLSSAAPCFTRKDVEPAIARILKKEYNIDAVVKTIGQTLWVYLPLTDLLGPPPKPEKYTERFEVDPRNSVSYQDALLRLQYRIEPIPPRQKSQQLVFTKDALRQIGGGWQTIRRVMFSADRQSRNEIKFYCLVAADIENGFEIRQIAYYQDLAKVSYRIISITEYQHRVISDTSMSPAVVGDTAGSHIVMADLAMKDFLAQQIRHRINLKFQKPEVDAKADIDQEVARIVKETLAIYQTKDFTAAELANLKDNTARMLQIRSEGFKR